MTVYIVDDDAGVRDSLALMLGLAGYATAMFADAEALLAAYSPAWAGCIVADLRLPGATGLELQEKLRNRGCRLPFIIITAHGDVPSARAAFRAQAVDFIEKPFQRDQLLAALEAALATEERRASRTRDQSAAGARLSTLTQREREVLQQAARGRHAKEIAANLGISSRTVEVHKARIMAKLGVRNVVELVRVALDAPPEDRED